jgi:hypothetical protein
VKKKRRGKDCWMKLTNSLKKMILGLTMMKMMAENGKREKSHHLTLIISSALPHTANSSYIPS